MTWWRTALGAADRREVPLVVGLVVLLVADGLYRAEGEFTLAAVGALARGISGAPERQATGPNGETATVVDIVPAVLDAAAGAA